VRYILQEERQRAVTMKQVSPPCMKISFSPCFPCPPCSFKSEGGIAIYYSGFCLLEILSSVLCHGEIIVTVLLLVRDLKRVSVKANKSEKFNIYVSKFSIKA